MKNRKCIGLLGMAALVLGLLLAGCEDPSGSEPYNPTYTITFSTGEGGGTPPGNQSITQTGSITFPGQGSMTAPEGKIFWGWMRGNDNSRLYQENDTYSPGLFARNETLTAVWAGLISAAFDPGEGGGTPPDSIIADEYGLSFTIPSFPGQGDMTAPEDKSFRGWRDLSSEGTTLYEAGESVAISGDTTFTAIWRDYLVVTFSLGEVSGTPPESRTVESGTVITLPSVDAPEGKVFLRWFCSSITNSNGTFSDNPHHWAASEAVTITGNYTFTALWTNKKYAQEGVYVSLISFAGNAAILRNGGDFVFLESNTTGMLYYTVNNLYKKATEPGTALFYGVHKGLAHLTANEDEFLTDISSVNLITFTDGLDNGSFGASNNDPIEGQSGVTSTAYAAYVHDEIGSRTINGKPITAYSVGVKGADVEDEDQFAANLGNIASTQDKVREITNFSELGKVFTDIADTLSFANHFSVTTTQNDPGTIVRMTFDVTGTGSADAAASSKYLEGALGYSGGVWTLTNVTYGGITSDVAGGTDITGTVSGSNIRFLFRNTEGYDPATATVQQWTKASAGSTTWQRNSEYSATGSTSTSPVLIQLVLDASTSLSENQIGQIRTAVNNFITTLYNRVYGSRN